MNNFMYLGHAQLAALLPARPLSFFRVRQSVRLDLLNSLGTETRNIYYFPLKSETKGPLIPTVLVQRN